METITMAYSYTATDKNGLTVRRGDEIDVLEKDRSGWWIGRCKVRSSAIGIFPSTFIVKKGEEAAVGLTNYQITLPIRDGDLFVATTSFTAQDVNDLSFRVGDVIEIIEGSNNVTWWIGVCDGISGRFPADCVSRLKKKIKGSKIK